MSAGATELAILIAMLDPSVAATIVSIGGIFPVLQKYCARVCPGASRKVPPPVSVMTLFCVFTTHTELPLIRIVASPGVVVMVVTSPGVVVTVPGLSLARKCPRAHSTLIPRALCRV